VALRRQGVAAFFESLRKLTFTRFQPTRLTEVDEVHIWRFDRDGRVASMRHRVDTLRHQALAAALSG